MLPLTFLNKRHQSRFSFKKHKKKKLDNTELWIIKYSEKSRPTFIQSGGSDTFAEGEFWIDPSNGRVFKTVLRIGKLSKRMSTARIEVRYHWDCTLEVMVPDVMRERYQRMGSSIPLGEETVECRSTYHNFRQFQVQTEDKITIID